MLQAKKLCVISNLTYYCINSTHKSKPAFKFLQLCRHDLIKVNYSPKFRRLITLRSPKHFNIGKLQTYKCNFRYSVYLQVNRVFSIGSSTLSYLFSSIATALPQQPSTHINHVKLTVSTTLHFA